VAADLIRQPGQVARVDEADHVRGVGVTRLVPGLLGELAAGVARDSKSGADPTMAAKPQNSVFPASDSNVSSVQERK
jgi:hypothetical protein